MTRAETLFTARELATYEGIKLSTVYQRRYFDRGPEGFREGERIWFRKSDVDAWLAARGKTPAGAA